jgi:F-type H+-transporting ATPase subunit b
MLAAPSLLLLAVAQGQETSRNPITPSVNELVYGLLSFLVFFAFLAKYVLPRMNDALARRRALIEGRMEEAAADREAAAALLADYRAQLADARGEAGRILEAAHRQGEGIRKDAERQAQESAARIVAAGNAKAEADRQAVMAQLRGEVGGMAVELAERIVGASLSDDERQRALIDSFIAGVEDDSARGTTAAVGA